MRLFSFSISPNPLRQEMLRCTAAELPNSWLAARYSALKKKMHLILIRCISCLFLIIHNMSYETKLFFFYDIINGVKLFLLRHTSRLDITR